MSAAIPGFIIGFFLGGLFGMIMLSVIITASRADEREAKQFKEYMKSKPTMNEVRETFGFPPVEQRGEE